MGLEFREGWESQMLGDEVSRHIACAPADDPENHVPSPQLRVVAVVLIHSRISFSNSGLFSRVLQAMENKPSSRSLFTESTATW